MLSEQMRTDLKSLGLPDDHLPTMEEVGRAYRQLFAQGVPKNYADARRAFERLQDALTIDAGSLRGWNRALCDATFGGVAQLMRHMTDMWRSAVLASMGVR